MSEAAIETSGLSKTYHAPHEDVVAVDQLYLRVERGEVFGLLGPNRAGKSTTAGMLTTRIKPTGGVAMVAGIDVGRYPVAVKERIGVVTQHNTLDRQLTIRENLEFRGRYTGLSTRKALARANELLEIFGLGGRPGDRALGWSRAARAHRPRARAPAGHPVPRRADLRPRSADQGQPVGDPPDDARGGPDDLAHHALHGGGGEPLRSHRHHRPRQHARL